MFPSSPETSPSFPWHSVAKAAHIQDIPGGGGFQHREAHHRVGQNGRKADFPTAHTIKCCWAPFHIIKIFFEAPNTLAAYKEKSLIKAVLNSSQRVMLYQLSDYLNTLLLSLFIISHDCLAHDRFQSTFMSIIHTYTRMCTYFI